MVVYIGDYPKRRWYHRLFLWDTPERKSFINVSRADTYSLDSTLSMVISKSLRRFKEDVESFPGHPVDVTYDEWIDIIDTMIWAFEEVNKDYESPLFEEYEDSDEDLKEYSKKLQEHEKNIQDGIELFAKYYRNLWW